MPATLAWIDHDAVERERMQRVLRMFDEPGTFDQLGLGGIRDAISDRLFPGTSTIQTRLRYFLFVPWIYRLIEQERVPSSQAAARAREMELELIAPLKASGADGVLGGVAGTSLKILPSAIYWSGLRIWGIRRFSGSRSAYHRALDDLYVRRKHGRSDDEGSDHDAMSVTWDPALPDPPADFPEHPDMDLTRPEADFLQARILAMHPHSLLALLAKGGEPTETQFPWQHPRHADFGELHMRLLHHARLFSEVRYGAAVLYNLVVARTAQREDLVDLHTESLTEWRASAEHENIANWDIEELWILTLDQGHAISAATRRFVQEWVMLVLESPDLANEPRAAELVKERERRIKGNRSKFDNPIALEEKWSGHDGIGRLDYRWSNVQRHLNDLYAGLAT